jgi:cephalosporin hydroxylase
MASGLRRLRAAAVDRVDSLVLRRTQTLLNRAEQGIGRRAEDVRSALRGASSEVPDPAYVEAITPSFSAAWDHTTGDIYASPELRQAVVDQFHRLYYHSPWRTWQNTRYRGVLTAKCPLDMWIYQEILHEVRPDVILECGTNRGGSALYLADLCETIGNGRVVTVDVEDVASQVSHPRMTKLYGSSTDPAIHAEVLAHLEGAASVLVILDSDHSYGHVHDELKLWSDVVTPGSYLIVEDTDINGHPVLPSFGPGPWEALHDFLESDDRFTIDESREKFMMTSNPRGYLRRS